MRSLAASCSIAMVGSLIAFATPSPARANPPCSYWVFVSRENFPGERSARVCDVNRIAEWLAAVPDATVSNQRPDGALNDGFTVTVVAVSGDQRIEGPTPV